MVQQELNDVAPSGMCGGTMFWVVMMEREIRSRESSI